LIESIKSGEAYVVVAASDTNLKVGDKIIVNAEEYARSSDSQEISYKTLDGGSGTILRKNLKAQI
jgi:hypothetical protein